MRRSYEALFVMFVLSCAVLFAQSHTVVTIEDNQTISGTKTFSATVVGSINGNAATASSLASVPTGCSSPNFARGITAVGNANCFQPSDITGNAATATNLAANPTDCPTGPQTYAKIIAASGNLTCQQVPFSDLSGNIAMAQINNGTNADASHLLRGDNTFSNALSGPFTFNSGATINGGNLVINGGATLGPVVTPTILSASQNNYSGCTGGAVGLCRISSNSSAYHITGLSGGVAGQTFVIENIGSIEITLDNQSASSTAANRFSLLNNASGAVYVGEALVVIYDGTSSRWTVLSVLPQSGSSTNAFFRADRTWSNTLTGGINVVGMYNNGGYLYLNSPTTPSAIIGNQNDYAGCDSSKIVCRMSSTGVINVTGLDASAASGGQVFVLLNAGSNNITLTSLDAASMHDNRFAIAANITLAANEAVTLWYDDGISQWRVIGKGF